MKSPLSIILCLFILVAQGQSKDELMNTLTDFVCNCIGDIPDEKLESNAIQVVGICVQDGMTQNIDALINVYGDDVITSEKIGEEIGAEISNRLIKECDHYRGFIVALQNNTDIIDADYNEEQWNTIYKLSDITCGCIDSNLTEDPSIDLQITLETCMQKSVFKNISTLTTVFGPEFLTDQAIAYNMGIEVGKILVEECESLSMNSNSISEEIMPELWIEMGSITNYSDKGDYFTISFKNLDGEEKDFVLNGNFEGISEFVTQLKELKKEERIVTFYYFEYELYFKSENISKKVLTIESVKY